MYCLVDFRNRPQQKYTFSKIEQARECLRRIQNNPLGVTVFLADGRREYFENGLPQGFFASSDSPRTNYKKTKLFKFTSDKQRDDCDNSTREELVRGKAIRIKKGCHTKYHIRAMSNFDGVLKKNAETRNSSAANWQKKSIFSLFMLGNRKVYASLAIVSFVVFGSTIFFQNQSSQNAATEVQGQVAGATDERIAPSGDETDNSLNLADDGIVMNLLGKIENARAGEFETEILRYVKGKPMEDMAPFIAKQPRTVAAFLVGIAMKESKFGTYSPKLGGRDCHNYWGFKGGGVTASGGYTCFDTPEEAIQVVGKRIARLVDGGRTSPSAMVVWKCGSTCSWDNPENVRKWIADVGVNFYKINAKENT